MRTFRPRSLMVPDTASSRLRTLFPTGVLAAALLLLVGCTSSHLEPTQVQGPPAMVDDGGTPRLWVLTKQEEKRQVGVGGGGRNRLDWRTYTFFHFGVQAFETEADGVRSRRRQPSS